MEIVDMNISNSEPNLLRQSLYDLSSNSYRLIVDDLCLFRKKLQPIALMSKNNLHIAEGSFKDVLSEYMYCYGIPGGRKSNLDAIRPKYMMTTSHSFNSLKELALVRSKNSQHFTKWFHNDNPSFIRIGAEESDSDVYPETKKLRPVRRKVIEPKMTGRLPRGLNSQYPGSGEEQDGSHVSSDEDIEPKSETCNENMDIESSKNVSSNTNNRSQVIKFDRNGGPVTFRFREHILIKNRSDSNDVFSTNWSHSIRFKGNDDNVDNDVQKVDTNNNLAPKGILKNNGSNQPNVYRSRSVVDITVMDSDSDNSYDSESDDEDPKDEQTFFKNRHESRPEYRRAVTHYIQKEHIDRLRKPLKSGEITT